MVTAHGRMAHGDWGAQYGGGGGGGGGRRRDGRVDQ